MANNGLKQAWLKAKVNKCILSNRLKNVATVNCMMDSGNYSCFKQAKICKP